jgi:hypothetical protein
MQINYNSPTEQPGSSGSEGENVDVDMIWAQLLSSRTAG